MAVSVLVLGATGSASLARAQSPDVPQSWISYAQLVGRQFQACLETDDDSANQLHQYLEDRILKAQDDAPPAAIVVRAWIDSTGGVTRVAFDSLGDPNADAILRRLLRSRTMTEPPPPDMLQPLRVRLRLEVNPAAEPGSPSAPPDIPTRSP